MNKEWSELNQTMQEQIKRRDTYETGIKTLLSLRSILFHEMMQFKADFDPAEFCAIPFINHKGYESKTIAYSFYHVFRIEDIVASQLIWKKEEVFFQKDYQQRMGSPIITTGNELVKEEIVEFSKRLNIDELYAYILDVYEESNRLLTELPYERLKEKMTPDDQTELRKLGVVSEDENAIWLLEYWCSKNVKGLLQMPFSRHWIMHLEACNRIAAKLKKGKV